MKLLSYSANGEDRVGILDGERIRRVNVPNMLSLIESGSRATSAGANDALSQVKILPSAATGQDPGDRAQLFGARA